MSRGGVGSGGCQVRHEAQFYDDVGFLAGRVAALFADALTANGAALCVARPTHQAAIEGALVARGVTVSAHRERLVFLDADETLRAISTDGALDGARFHAVIGGRIRQLRGAHAGPIHVYGEMVDLLWVAGKSDAVLELERLWNELGRAQPFSLLCGYGLGAFAAQRHVGAFHELCSLHTRTLPTIDLEGLVLDATTTRTIAELEQRARALEVEIAQGDLLYQLAATCNEAPSLPRVLDDALAIVQQGTACERSAVLLFDDAGVLRFEASRGLSSAYRRAVEGHSPWSRDTRDPSPILVGDAQRDPAWARFQDTFRAEGIGALAFIPLVHQHALLGKFMLYRDDARPLTTVQLQFAQTVAVHVALAIARARDQAALSLALVTERDARVEADAAIRAREEILSVVSHDLRNPLGKIVLGASLLTGAVGGGVVDGARVARTAQRIQREAERMARLIDDLVDFASIQAGRLAIARAPCPPAGIIAQARDLFGPLAEERGLAFQTRADDDLPAVDCDSDRAVQILSNLVTNAIKVTPKGGAIVVGAAAESSGVVFYVRDTGPGIEPEDLPNVFERFWRSKRASYKGAGLGLSIARGLVDAHGGRIWAESRLGSGSTFFFSLTPP